MNVSAEGRSTRFVSVELSYGCQHRRLELGPPGRPFVLAGPNGAGKTTLVEGIVRTLYGFNRQKRAEKQLIERREPWGEEDYAGRVVIERGDGVRLEVSRDFRADRVTARELRPGAGPDREARVLFDGTANPGSGRRDAATYRALLAEWLGFGDIEEYQRTMCIEQGELRATVLSEYLLQLAAGGHAALDAAKDTLRTAFRELTREGMEEGDRRRPKSKALEVVSAEITEYEDRLRFAREVERSRKPLRQEERDLSGRAEAAASKIATLEDALDPLAHLEKLNAQCETLEDRLQRLERFAAQLRERVDAVERAEKEWTRICAEPLYPDDFLERVAALQEKWSDRVEAERELVALTVGVDARNVYSGVPMGLVAAGIVALVATPFTGGALAVLLPVLALAFLGGGGFLIWRARERLRIAEARRADVGDRVTEIRERIAERLAGIPRAETLTAESAPDHRERFLGQLRAGKELARLRDSLEELLAAVGADLPSQGELPLLQGAPPPELERAAGVAQVLEQEVSRTRTELAKRSLELERSQAVTISLPDGLEPSFGAVRVALDARRSEHRDLSARLTELSRRLLEAESGPKPLSLEVKLDGLRLRRDALETEVAATRAAFELLDDAYTEFRAGDQERLLDAVSAQLEQVSGGALGPVATDSVLEAAHVVVRGRKLPLASPPLSYGELHAVLLAVRLGAADFLAGSGHGTPLLIDEPFTYLDEGRAAQVWAQLREVGRGRQTIITTQARLLLDHLDVEPDLWLEAPDRIESTSP